MAISFKPSPAVVPLQLCTNRGGLYNKYTTVQKSLSRCVTETWKTPLCKYYFITITYRKEGLTPGSFTLESAQSSVPTWIRTKGLPDKE
jgi:hypothetical protein